MELMAVQPQVLEVVLRAPPAIDAAIAVLCIAKDGMR